MKRAPTNLMRGTLDLIGLGVVALCLFALPSIWRDAPTQSSLISYSVYAIVIIVYVTMIPFFIAFRQTFHLLHSIDQNKIFSTPSIHSLHIIKRCALIICLLYAVIVPLLFPIADADDAPGLILIGTALSCIPFIFAVFIAVLEQILQNAIDIQSENNLLV